MEIYELFSILRSSAILPEFLISWLVHLWIWLVDFWIWQMHFLIERNNLSRLGFTDDRLLFVEPGAIALYIYNSTTQLHQLSSMGLVRLKIRELAAEKAGRLRKYPIALG